MTDLGFENDSHIKFKCLTEAKTDKLLKHSLKYKDDDEYLVDPSLIFNFARNTFTSTITSINDRYNSDSSLKTNDPIFAKKVVDRFFEKVPQPKLNFEQFMQYAAPKLEEKIKDMVRKKEINGMTDLEDDTFMNLTNWFVKEQFKFDAKPEIKPAQGIIAWSKSKNLIYLPMMKYLEYYFNEMKDQGTFMNPAKSNPYEFRLFIQETFIPENICYCSDISGFDKMQNATTLEMERQFYDRIFFQVFKETRNYHKYFENRAKFSVIGEFITFMINHIKASGEPGTIDFNTLVKYLQTNYILDIEYDKPGTVLIQGDDDMINKPYKINEKNKKEMATKVTLKLKEEETFLPEFAGKIIYKAGYVPDLWRSASRLFVRMNTKYYKDKMREPVNNRFYTEYERKTLNIDPKDMYITCIKKSVEDAIKITDEQRMILNAFYKRHFDMEVLGDISLEYMKYFVEEEIELLLKDQ